MIEIYGFDDVENAAIGQDGRNLENLNALIKPCDLTYFASGFY